MLIIKDIQDYLGGSLDPCPKKDVIVNHADEMGLEWNKLGPFDLLFMWNNLTCLRLKLHM